jgi:hypothetical protein
MKMWWVVEQLRPWYPPEPAAVSREERWFSQPAVVSGPFPSPPVLSSSPTGSEPPPPLAVAVLFGVWRAENIVLPTCPGFLGDWKTLYAHPAVADPARDYPVYSLLDAAFLESERPNHFQETYPVPPLELKFFEYCFRRQLNACFLEEAFLTGQLDLLDLQRDVFVDCITIFCHDDVEGCCAGFTRGGDFIVGSELLQAWPPHGERFYQSERLMF